MESFLRSIKSHADEISGALSDLERFVMALEGRATQAGPLAAEFEKVAKELVEKQKELEAVTQKVNATNAALANLRKQIG